MALYSAEYRKEYNKKHYEENKEKRKQQFKENYRKIKEIENIMMFKKPSKQQTPEMKEYMRQYDLNRRKNILSHLGGKCASCGNDNWRVQQVDHINNDGYTDKRGTTAKQKDILLYGTSKYQIMCCNCHIIKTKQNIKIKDNNDARLTPEHRERVRLNRFRNRMKCIDLLGGCCVSCSNSDERVLQFDHINNDGNLDRPGNRVQSGLFKDVLEHGKAKYQLLCANCHAMKTYGYNNS